MGLHEEQANANFGPERSPTYFAVRFLAQLMAEKTGYGNIFGFE